jgi:GAF domain-containing protein
MTTPAAADATAVAPPPDGLPAHLHEAARSVLMGLRAGEFCALLGPISSGKSDVLRYVHDQLEATRWLSLSVDLSELQALSEADFFGALVNAISGQLSTLELLPVPLDVHLSPGLGFGAFLTEQVSSLDCDLVLLIDHLEAIPNDLVRALLRSLRVVHQGQTIDGTRLMVAVAGAFSLGTLTLGPTSPFNIARPVFLGDLTWDQDVALIVQELAALGVQASELTRRYLRLATAGDPGLIRLICQRCSTALKPRPVKGGVSVKTLAAPTVQRIVREFLAADAVDYKPLKDAIDLIEDDADLLQSILPLLQREQVPQRDLPLALTSDLDPLYLTGLVRIEGENYRFRNEIYRQHLLGHFTPGRVGHLLTMAGRWDEAISHLADSVQVGHEQYRADLLEAAINSMRAAPDGQAAAHFLARGLSDAFGLARICVWQTVEFESRLQLLWCEANGRDHESPEIAVWEDRLEARAYREACTLGGPTGEGELQRAFPLIVGASDPIGVVTTVEPASQVPPGGRHNYDLVLQGYLVQAARALHDVIGRHEQEDRRRKLAETLREIATNLNETLDRARVYDVILTQMARVLPFDTASIQLPFDDGLHIVAGYGFEAAGIEKTLFPLEDRFPNVRVYKSGAPRRYDAIQDEFPHFKEDRYQAQKVRGWLGVPLLIGDETIGVITLDSFTRGRYSEEHEQAATIFASMAALAIRNAGLYQVIKDELQRRIERMRAATEIDVAISSTLKLQDILSLILSRTLRHTDAVCGAVQLVDPSGSRLVLAGAQGVTLAKDGDELPVGRGVTGLAALHNRTYRVPDVTLEAWRDLYVPYAQGMRSELAVPMEFERRVVGVINIESSRADAFGQDDQEFVELLARQAAIAIHNAIRYQELQKSYEELERTRSSLLASQAVAWLGLFGADWQHTINQKTFSIDLYTAGLRDQLPPDDIKDPFAKQVEKALNGIERVVQSIRTVKFTSQVPAESSGESSAVVDETTLLDEELEAMVDRWAGEHPEVEVQYDLRCPGMHAAIPPKWLEVAMEKLVNNAIKSMPDGGLLTVASRRTGREAWITIKDTGHGVPESARKTFLKEVIKRPNGESGSGMGALIARFVVLSHGGDLSLVDSHPERGTELRMTLPLAPEPAPEGGG